MCEKVFAGIFTFSILFEIKMKGFSHQTYGLNNTHNNKTGYWNLKKIEMMRIKKQIK